MGKSQIVTKKVRINKHFLIRGGNMCEVARVEGVEKGVLITYADGTKKFVVKKEEKKGDPKFVEAMNVLRLVAINKIDELKSGEDQGYYNGLLENTGRYFHPEDDLDEAARLSAHYLQSKHMSAEDIAGIVVGTTKNLRLGFGTKNERLLVSRLAQIYTDYFPVNFPSNSPHPTKK